MHLLTRVAGPCMLSLLRVPVAGARGWVAAFVPPCMGIQLCVPRGARVKSTRHSSSPTLPVDVAALMARQGACTPFPCASPSLPPTVH